MYPKQNKSTCGAVVDQKVLLSNMLGIIPSKISQLGHWGLGILHNGGIRGVFKLGHLQSDCRVQF